jgi:hypothetical protein
MVLFRFQEINTVSEILDFKPLDELHIRYAHTFLHICLLLILKLMYTSKLRGVLGNKCAGHHNLKTVNIREIMFK